jgi:hypothetical protein
VAAGGSTYLLFAFAEGRAARATTAEIAERFGHDFELVEVRPGAPTWGQTWYRMLRR